MIKRMKLTVYFLSVLLLASVFSCSSKKEEFSRYFSSHQWRADYGKEGAPIIDNKMSIREILEDGVISNSGDTGKINSTMDTIRFEALSSAWVLIKEEQPN